MLDLTEQRCNDMLAGCYDASFRREEQKLQKLLTRGKRTEEEIVKELGELREDMDKKRDHSQRVYACCLDIVKALTPAPGQPETFSPPDTRLLYAAALLHDAAKFENDSYHHRLAVSAVKAVCGPYTPEDSRDFFVLDEIITAHKGGDFRPHPACAAEAAILRMADNLDRLWRKSEKLRLAEEAHQPRKKIEKKEEELEEAKKKYRWSVDIIRNFSKGSAPGTCGPVFFRALGEALQPRYNELVY